MATGKRIAIVTYYAPPERAVASHRVLRLSRELVAAGHEVSWVTLDADKVRNFDPTLDAETPAGIRRYGMGGHGLITTEAARNLPEKFARTFVFKMTDWFPVPDGYVGWNRQLHRHLGKILAENAIDTAFFCLGPHGSLMQVPRLRRQLPELKILIDYRDLLSGNFWRASKFAFNQRWLLARERRALGCADALFVNTEEARQRFLEIVQPPADFPVRVMRNAADFDLGARIAERLPAAELGEGIHLGFFGTIFANRRLLPIVEAMAQLEPELVARFRFHVYGGAEAHAAMKEDCEKVGLPDGVAVYHPFAGFGEALRAMQSMDALALVNGATPDDRIFVPGKLYDYLMARRPVLFVGEVGDAWRIVADCCGDEWCSRYTEPERLVATLRRLAEGRKPDVLPNEKYGPTATFAPLLNVLAP